MFLEAFLFENCRRRHLTRETKAGQAWKTIAAGIKKNAIRHAGACRLWQDSLATDCSRRAAGLDACIGPPLLRLGLRSRSGAGLRGSLGLLLHVRGLHVTVACSCAFGNEGLLEPVSSQGSFHRGHVRSAVQLALQLGPGQLLQHWRKHCGHKRNRVCISARLPAQAVRAACQHVFLESLEGQPLRGIQEPEVPPFVVGPAQAANRHQEQVHARGGQGRDHVLLVNTGVCLSARPIRWEADDVFGRQLTAIPLLQQLTLCVLQVASARASSAPPLLPLPAHCGHGGPETSRSQGKPLLHKCCVRSPSTCPRCSSQLAPKWLRK